ncbi:hypothetical protein GE061_001674 [Apolygus lucorum]|uniref:Uncharacterized protein n=1 Tax=Apolygus lucorum TaxID=248454 RepID=A0A8S9Y7T2_APOLU|nr:hypothetical protein GE061_001674 [Apolygus lucorum]
MNDENDDQIIIVNDDGDPERYDDHLQGNNNPEQGNEEEEHVEPPEPTQMQSTQSRVIEEVADAQDLGALCNETIDSSEASDLMGPEEEPTANLIDADLDELSSQSDSTSEDTISQNTVIEVLTPLKPYLGENTSSIVPQTDKYITSDNTINPDILIRTLPDVNINGNFDTDYLEELLNELPEPITHDIDGNENSGQSVEDLSSNPGRKNLFPSNANNTIEVPEMSSAEETIGSSTASSTRDSTEENNSLGEVTELTNESDSKANIDVDVEEISESETRTSGESSDPPKSVAEPESPKTNGGAPTSDVTAYLI